MNKPSLNVLRPTASTLDTSSYVSVPAIPTLPVTVRFPLNAPSTADRFPFIVTPVLVVTNFAVPLGCIVE